VPWPLELINGVLLLVLGIFAQRLGLFLYRLNKSFLENVPPPSALGLKLAQIILIGAGAVELVRGFLRAGGAR